MLPLVYLRVELLVLLFSRLRIYLFNLIYDPHPPCNIEAYGGAYLSSAVMFMTTFYCVLVQKATEAIMSF